MSYAPRDLPDGTRRRTPADRRREEARRARPAPAVAPGSTPRHGPPITPRAPRPTAGAPDFRPRNLITWDAARRSIESERGRAAAGEARRR